MTKQVIPGAVPWSNRLMLSLDFNERLVSNLHGGFDQDYSQIDAGYELLAKHWIVLGPLERSHPSPAKVFNPERVFRHHQHLFYGRPKLTSTPRMNPFILLTTKYVMMRMQSTPFRNSQGRVIGSQLNCTLSRFLNKGDLSAPRRWIMNVSKMFLFNENNHFKVIPELLHSQLHFASVTDFLINLK